jgi:hypothetical protein
VIWRTLVALLLGVGILVVGLWLLKAISGSGSPHGEGGPEDVADLDVFFVCWECGTEYRVTKVGEVSIPRHCGEPMQVERRSRNQG